MVIKVEILGPDDPLILVLKIISSGVQYMDCLWEEGIVVEDMTSC